MPTPLIVYRADVPHMPAWGEAELQSLMTSAGVPQLLVTSTWRFPSDQARIMYDLIQQKGIQYALDLYGAAGDQVIAVYSATMPRGAVIMAMTQRILEIGSQRISNHMNPANCTFDVAPSSMPDDMRARFITVLRGAKAAGKLAELILPPDDPAIHIAIPVMGRGGWPPGAPEAMSTVGKVAIGLLGAGLLWAIFA